MQSVRCKKDETVLDALSNHNVKSMVYGCFGGGCGKCLIQVHRGSYSICKQMSKAHINVETKDKLLACCIMPRSDMEISIL